MPVVGGAPVVMLMLMDVREAFWGPTEQLIDFDSGRLIQVPFFFHPFSGRSNHIDISLTFIPYL